MFGFILAHRNKEINTVRSTHHRMVEEYNMTLVQSIASGWINKRKYRMVEHD